MSDNLQMWLELANALMLLAAILSIVGFGFGYIVGRCLERQAQRRRDRAWIEEHLNGAKLSPADELERKGNLRPLFEFWETHCRKGPY